MHDVAEIFSYDYCIFLNSRSNTCNVNLHTWLENSVQRRAGLKACRVQLLQLT
jgi:hypothetical protein